MTESIDGQAESSPERHWFEDVADHVGPAYLRYSFTKGTTQEVDFLVEELGLTEGMTVLDVGCGPGRHSVELARRGIRAIGIDISEEFIRIAKERAETEGVAGLVEFTRGDARNLTFDGVADAAISLCQGAFGLGGSPVALDPQNLLADSAVLRGMRAALRPGGLLAVSAFSSYFQVRFLEEQDQFAAASAINHETTELMDEAGVKVESELWTTCYTPRELRLLAEKCGLAVANIYSVTPGAYRRVEPSTDTPEFLLLASRPN
ncbi:MAG TPA: class I SAM-dependent methyltransferase [Microthrixaceae bacterium]|nr:class I SAM-dependent methyltransferase [Microthrixaceae bacterium]